MGFNLLLFKGKSKRIFTIIGARAAVSRRKTTHKTKKRPKSKNLAPPRLCEIKKTRRKPRKKQPSRLSAFSAKRPKRAKTIKTRKERKKLSILKNFKPATYKKD